MTYEFVPCALVETNREASPASNHVTSVCLFVLRLQITCSFGLSLPPHVRCADSVGDGGLCSLEVVKCKNLASVSVGSSSLLTVAVNKCAALADLDVRSTSVMRSVWLAEGVGGIARGGVLTLCTSP